MEVEVPAALKGKRILVVDDQGSIRAVFQAFLRDLGFRNVLSAIDGEDSVHFLEKHAVDLIICDWAMPKLSGLEVLHIIRAHEQTKDLPFMMVTSSSEIAKVQQAVELGVSDYLIKPFQPGQLCQKVISLLQASDYKAQKLPIQDLTAPRSADEDLTQKQATEASADEQPSDQSTNQEPAGQEPTAEKQDEAAG